MTEAPVFPGAINPAEVARVTNYPDAAFIVRACNAHDELVAALRNLASLTQPHDWKNYFTKEKAIECLRMVNERAKAALAKAELGA